MNLLIISPYPSQTKAEKLKSQTNALFTQSLVHALKKTKKSLSITILAEKLNGMPYATSEDGIEIRRVWKKGSSFSLIQILKSILTSYSDTKSILITFNFGSFQSIISFLFFPLFLLVLKLLRKKVSVIMSEIIVTSNDIRKYINISNSVLIYIIYLFFQELYSFILESTAHVIVFEEVLRKNIQSKNYMSATTIPYGITANNTFSKIDARKKLRLQQDVFIVTSLGPSAWHRGTDWLIQAFAKARRQRKRNQGKIMLLITGGTDPFQKNNRSYRNFLKRVEEDAKENDIVLTGYLPAEKVDLYISASDLLIFPYRTFISSNSLSKAISFKKPFILSKPLEGIFKTRDIAQILKDLKIDKHDLLFGFNQDIGDVLRRLENDTKLQKKASELSRRLSVSRSWYAIGRKYYEILFS